MGEHEGRPYIVLPVMSGGDVEGLIEKATEHRLPLGQVISIAKSVCRGLEFAHSKGIIHRDLKPGNVWMSADGTARRLTCCCAGWLALLSTQQAIFSSRAYRAIWERPLSWADMIKPASTTKKPSRSVQT
jgi:serine/threonine protein kinase